MFLRNKVSETANQSSRSERMETDDRQGTEVEGRNLNQVALSGSEYEAAFGESLSNTLDLETWRPGADLVEMYERLSREIVDAVKQETAIQKQIREEVFPRLSVRPGAPPGAGVYRATPRHLEEVHKKLLFNGGVEACDGTVAPYDTLPVTITQIGVCLVSYSGDQGSWVHRIYRRDLRSSGKNPVEETLDLLEKRRQRGAVDIDNSRDRLSSLAQRGIMAYAERAVLLDRSDAVWRMGHGNPTPYELVTGSGMKELLRAALRLMRRLIMDHQKFIFVPSTVSARELLTIGNALQPLEYAIVDTNQGNLERIAAGHYRGDGWGTLSAEVQDFVRECGPKVVTGLYRASEFSPCQVFYAHVDHAHEAALIAMADSVLQEHRGFPMLIDLADGLCSTIFNAGSFSASIQLAYAEAREPFRYMSERKTRG
jgi:hypothetical protein